MEPKWLIQLHMYTEYQIVDLFWVCLCLYVVYTMCDLAQRIYIVNALAIKTWVCILLVDCY